jgi:hypothetical protein
MRCIRAWLKPCRHHLPKSRALAPALLVWLSRSSALNTQNPLCQTSPKYPNSFFKRYENLPLIALWF